MRVTISHNKPLEQVKAAVDHHMGQVFNGLGGGLVEFTDNHHQWHGDTMVFSMTARIGFVRTPMKGTVAVTTADVTVDVDLGLLENLIPQETVRNGIEGRVRGLLT
jgi:hypothetical protein